MKQHRLAQALGLGLAMTMAAGALAQNGHERVWVKFHDGGKGPVQRALKSAGAEFHYTFDNLNAFAVTLPAQAIAGIRNNPHVEYVEADPIRVPLAQSVPFGIDLVQSRDVWDANRDGVVDAGAATGDGVLVCIVDSGLYPGHEDHSGAAGVTITGESSPGVAWDTDTCGHGTHVAGTVRALNNNLGVVGVSPGAVDLHIVRVFSGGSDGCGWTFSSGLADAVNRCQAAANGRKVVINMSLGGSFSSQTENTAFENLFATGNVLSVAAAGNDGNTRKSYPASYNSVISVAAIDSNKALASFSQRNDQVELAAPGVSVLSTVPWSAASLTVGADSFQVAALDGTFQGTASGALADGGRCTAAGSWAGKVVLCERGDISFANKVANVTQGGGVAAVIYNNAPGGFAGTLNGSSSIPAVSATQEDGQFLVANRLGATAEVSTVFTAPGSGYEAWDGTSMATPHVSGVAALLWSGVPTASNQAIRDAMAATAEDLGAAGRDTSFGFGLVRAKAALDALQGGGEPPPPPPDEVVVPSNLSATVLKTKGQATGVSLTWTPGTAAEVDIVRNGTVVATVSNSGGYTDSNVGPKRSTATYKVCVTGSGTACSNEVTVRF